MTFPPQLAIAGPAPQDDHTCNDCDRPYTEHTGTRCAICGHAIEHHNTDRVAFEVAACARLSAARIHAGLPVRPHEQWSVDTTRKDPHP